MDKVVKISIILSTLIASLSIGYYLVIFLPNKEKVRTEQQDIEKEKEAEKELEQTKRQQQEVAERCFRDAKIFHEKYRAEQENSSVTNTFVVEPRYFYNKKMARCLYSGGYNIFLPDGTYHHRVVKDVYTNETIISMSPSYIDGKTVTKKEDSDKFWEVHNVIMYDSGSESIR